MTIFAIPVGAMARALKAIFVANPVAGVAVSAAALVGYAIYEGVRKK